MNIVISYCLYGKDPRYLRGAIKCAGAQRAYQDALPGQVTQVFLVDSERTPLWAAAAIEARGGIVTNIKTNNHLELIRFTVSDLDSDVFFVRDVDSRVSGRELQAMKAFLASPYAFHVMRDHPYHYAPVMAGMWGGLCRMFKHPHDSMTERIAHWQSENPCPPRDQRYGYDQQFLREDLWPFMQQYGVLQHDTFHRSRFGGSVPFPDGDDSDSFVGEIFDEDNHFYLEHREFRKKYLAGELRMCEKCSRLLPTETEKCPCQEKESSQ